MAKLSVKDLDVNGKLVLLRVDFNVPLAGNQVADDARITASLPTIRHLIEHGARVVMCAHLGRPKGKPDARYSLKPVAEHLERLLDKNVGFSPETVGATAQEMAARLAPGGLLMVENLRFQPGEEANDAAFARQLSELGEVYVNDAFGADHRAHASTVGVTKFFTQAAAGFLLQKELDYLGRVLVAKDHPFVVILGGAKISDKLPLIAHLAKQADRLLIGGGMAYTFLKAQGQGIGDSLVQEDFLDAAKKLLAESRPGQFVLPVDHVLEHGEVVRDIPAGGKAMDIGPESRANFAGHIATAKILFWNGPMGVFEKPPLDAGTLAVARAVAMCAGVTVAGGGDSVAALRAAGVEDKLSHVSTGGGASLEFLSGDVLPGVAALTDR